ncbi:hypothetical protein PG994_006872 [Apiospora phragmitis]|uniref:SDR family NAD(P)-dependent oxidoreductase n=1 Tax=Apiospora phragmitis TaxID=2905665 RepID=A0ABR1VGA0_9PEZI
MADPGVQNLDHFTATQHQKPGSTLRSAVDGASAQQYHVCIIGASTAIGKGLATSYARAGCRALVRAARGPGFSPSSSRGRPRRFSSSPSSIANSKYCISKRWRRCASRSSWAANSAEKRASLPSRCTRGPC